MSGSSSTAPVALNDQQRAAVEHTEGPLMVIAGAGSGKTKMLTSRIAHLITHQHVSPYQILAVTFTNKAAAEMRHRVGALLRTPPEGTSVPDHALFSSPEIGTFHSVCLRILRRERAYTPFTRAFVIYDDSDQLSLIKSTFKALGLSADEKAERSSRGSRASLNPQSVQSWINQLRCRALDAQDLSPTNHWEERALPIYARYERELIQNHAVDFGEIICLTYRILRDNPDLRARYQRRYRYVHVDEYQDTNRAQFLLLSQLAAPDHGGHLNICVVGDEDQSIYKWRGADIKNILEFEQSYPEARVIKLEENYRSTQNILSAAGQMIAHNARRRAKTLWTRKGAGPLLRRVSLSDERAEAEMVVAEIQRLQGEHPDWRLTDFAIFYRTHAQSRQYEEVLRREKVDYRIVGGLRFYDRKEIKDLLSYLKLIVNPADSVSLKRVINVPARGIGKTTIEKLEQLASSSGVSLTEALRRVVKEPKLLNSAVAKKIGGFVEILDELMAFQATHPLLSELYHHVLDVLHYVRELKEEGTDEAETRVQNLTELSTLLQEFEESHLEGLEEGSPEYLQKKAALLEVFLEESALVGEAPASEQAKDDRNALHLMTLHSSKGLEFPVVFMVGMEEGLFPSKRVWEAVSDEEMEEERRLCYVGMTRARELLYLSHVSVRRIWGQVTPQEPSRFFDEIPQEFVEAYVPPSAQSYRLGSSRQWGDRSSTREPAATRSPRLRLLPDLPAEAAGTYVGRRLLHPKFGGGQVVGSDGIGSTQTLTLIFDGTRHERKFLLRYVASYLES